jgi:predicted O-methyltransferase YrrM
VIKLHQIRSYFSYWLEAVDEHSLHSPFLYQLYTKAIKRDHNKFQNHLIEEVRDVLLYDDRIIEVKDNITGANGVSKRYVNEHARRSLAPQRSARLYQRLVEFCSGKKILELGTSFGITAMYLANIKNSYVFTFEGAPDVASLAKRNFKFGDRQNIEVITGDIADTLPRFVSSSPKIDAVLMDANHHYEPTLKYFNWLLPVIHSTSIIIMDDIHYSPEMEKAWKEIKNHEQVHASIDLFRCGILFFDPSLNKQHVVLQLN